MSLLGGYQGRCYLCDSQEDVEQHHIDWHHGNNGSGNRIPLCHRCHVELHKAGYLSWEELERIRDKVRAERTPEAAAVSGVYRAEPGQERWPIKAIVAGSTSCPGTPETNSKNPEAGVSQLPCLPWWFD